MTEDEGRVVPDNVVQVPGADGTCAEEDNDDQKRHPKDTVLEASVSRKVPFVVTRSLLLPHPPRVSMCIVVVGRGSSCVETGLLKS